MENPQLWKLCQDANQRLMKIYIPKLQDAALSSGLEGNEWAGWILPAYCLDPHPISAQTLRIRSAYTNPALLTARLAKFAGRGFLSPDDNGYRLTEKGMATAKNMIAAIEAALESVALMDGSQLTALSGLLDEVIQKCLQAPVPERKWSLEHNRGVLSKSKRSAIVNIDQSLSDLFAWRDDCHLAAWQPYHYVQGFIWEAFTILWRKQASTVFEICEILTEKRGFDCDEYQLALDELRIRGWAKETGGKYSVTPSGSRVRHYAEEFTEELFYKPISTLDPARINELEHLLTKFITSLPE